VPLFEPGTTEYLLWIGCSVRYEESAQQVARAMVRILDAAGVSFGILGEVALHRRPGQDDGQRDAVRRHWRRRTSRSSRSARCRR
jgi:Fe-S oxidoreductase